MTVKNESLIHVKLEYGEAIQSKRDILSSVRDLIRLLVERDFKRVTKSPGQK